MLALANKLTLSTQPTYRFVNKYSIDFDGVDDCIVTDGADTVAQPTTYSFWCKTSTTTQNFVFGHGSVFMGGFQLNNSGNPRPLLYLGLSNYRYWTDIPAQYDGEWHHWVVYSDTNDITNSKLYVDGVLQAVTSTVTGSTTAYTESLTIGGDKASGGNYFEGKIDEFAVFDRELTQDEITRMYNTYYSPNRVANGNFSQIGNEEVTNGDFSQIGSELVTNGDYSSGDAGWSTSSGWTFNNIDASFDGLAYQPIRQDVGLVTGKIYKITFTLNISSGNMFFQLGGGSTSYTTSDTYTIYEEATSHATLSAFISIF